MGDQAPDRAGMRGFPERATSSKFAWAEILHQDQFDSGSGVYTKPLGPDYGDTVLVELYGAGGSGAAVGLSSPQALGGEGGCYLAIAFPYGEFPDTAAYSVGAGGASRAQSSGVATGLAGGNSTITISGKSYVANGGSGGAGAQGGAPTITTNLGVTIADIAFSFGTTAVSPPPPVPPQYLGAAMTDSAGKSGVYGGGSGGRANGSSAGGSSVYGGAGGAGATASTNATATAGSAPGGGGGGCVVTAGGTANSGAGGSGRIRITVIRGWHPTPISEVVI